MMLHSSMIMMMTMIAMLGGRIKQNIAVIPDNDDSDA